MIIFCICMLLCIIYLLGTNHNVNNDGNYYERTCRVRDAIKDKVSWCTFYLNELKKTWPVSVLLLVSVQQGMFVTCTYHTPS